MMIAWSHSRPVAKAVGLFDKDEDAQKTAKDTKLKIKIAPSGKTAFVVSLMPSENLKECARRQVKVPFAIEELLAQEIWDYAEINGRLEDRSNPIGLYKFNDTNTTFTDYIARKLPEPHLHRLAMRKPQLEKKEALAKYVATLTPMTDRQHALEGLKPTLTEILKNLGFDIAESTVAQHENLK